MTQQFVGAININSSGYSYGHTRFLSVNNNSNLLIAIMSLHDYNYIQLAKGGNHCAKCVTIAAQSCRSYLMCRPRVFYHVSICQFIYMFLLYCLWTIGTAPNDFVVVSPVSFPWNFPMLRLKRVVPNVSW